MPNFGRSSPESQSSSLGWAVLGVGSTDHPEDFIEKLWDLIIGISRYARIPPSESMDYALSDLYCINASVKKLLEKENTFNGED